MWGVLKGHNKINNIGEKRRELLDKNQETEYVNPEGQQLSAAFLQILLPELLGISERLFVGVGLEEGFGEVDFLSFFFTFIYLSKADLVLEEIYESSTEVIQEGSEALVRTRTFCPIEGNPIRR